MTQNTMTTPAVASTPQWQPLNVACPSHQLLQQLGDRWSMLVLSALSRQPSYRFGELKTAVDGISDKMLTKTLHGLQSFGLVELVVRHYALTDVGRSFIPILQQVVTWAAEHMDAVLDKEPAYLIVPSPLGKLGVSASEHGVTRLSFDAAGRPTGTADTPAMRHAQQAAQELQEYFAGHRQTFTVARDAAAIAKDVQENSFRYRCWQALIATEYGHQFSYGQLAAQVGSEKAVRAVGTACKRNPWPILVPCHRVIKANGDIGEYVGGRQRKAFLLDLEGQHYR